MLVEFLEGFLDSETNLSFIHLEPPFSAVSALWGALARHCRSNLEVTLGVNFRKCVVFMYDSKWFEPRSISSSYCVIVRVSVVLKRTVVGD